MSLVDPFEFDSCECKECGKTYWGPWGTCICGKPKCREKTRLREVCEAIEKERRDVIHRSRGRS